MARQDRANQKIQAEIQDSKGGVWETPSNHTRNNIPIDGSCQGNGAILKLIEMG